MHGFHTGCVHNWIADIYCDTVARWMSRGGWMGDDDSEFHTVYAHNWIADRYCGTVSLWRARWMSRGGWMGERMSG